MVVVEGPRFSTRAESRWFASAGWSLVNMTGHPEAVLARELALCYTSIALVTDYDAGVEHEVRQLVRGLEPAEDLIAAAEESDADVIVIGLRRRTPVGKLILGSNAQRILLDAPCPVLAVKADA